MHNRTVLISGASIAGPALAYWLRRYGFEPTIVERAAAPRPGGQAIDVRGTARAVLDRMGLLEAVRARHTGTHGIAYIDQRGRRKAVMAAEDFGDSGGIVAEIEILRGDLVRLLLDRAGEEVEYLYGNKITDLNEAEDGMKVTFAHGPARSFDLVVGADGVRSGVRSLAFGPESHYFRDLGYYTAYFAAHSDMDMGGWEAMLNLPAGNGVGGRVAIVYPIRDTGEVRVLLAFNSPELSYDRRDLAAQKDLLCQIFADAGWELPSLLAQLPQADDLYFARVGEVRVDGWSRGRTVLLGDAAFGGSIGMGTSMALVGAYVLAGELAAADGDHRRAYAAYEREMREYVTANQKRPPGSKSGFAPSTRAGIWGRNQLTKLMTRLPGKEKMMGDIQRGANLIRLKDYGL